MQSKGVDYNSIVQQDWSNSSTYAVLNHQWNIRLTSKHPLAYFIPTSTHSVEAGVKCGQEANIHLTPKSGGHSYEGYLFGDQDKIIVDFQEMDQVVIHQDEGTATIGPGALVGTVAARLSESGFGLPTGNCFSVGIGGHALGGGVGYLASKFGLLLDSIIEMTMVDALGIAHTINALQHPDLFWALRGIGSGLIGLVTEFKFKLFQTENMKIQLVELQYEMEDIGPVVLAWQDWLLWVKQNEPSVYSTINIQGSAKGFGFAGDVVFQAAFAQYDTEPEPSKKSELFLQKILSIYPKAQNIRNMLDLTYLEMMRYTGEVTSEYIPPSVSLDYLNNLREYPESQQFAKAKSFFVDKTYPGHLLDGILDMICNIPKDKVYICFQSNTGAITDIHPTSTAYVHRGSLYQVLVVAIGKESTNEEGLSWLQLFWQKSRFMDNGESAQNYVDSDLIEKNEYLKRFYGVNTERLILIKQTWDPQNYFRNPQSLSVL